MNLFRILLTSASSIAALTLAAPCLSQTQTDQEGQRRDKPTLISGVVVTAEVSPSVGYVTNDAIAATKIDLPVIQTPLAIQAVTQQTMRDQQVIRLQDAVATNVSSMALAPNGLSDNTNFTIRGFNTGTNVYRNGLLLPYTMNIDPVNIESVEVVKGSAAALYGRMAAGGLVDYLTKLPQDTAHYVLEEQLGSFGLTRTTIDLTGPLDAGKTLLYRLTGDFTHANAFVNYENSRNIFLSPSITWRPSDRFAITIQGEYQNVHNVDSDPNFPAVGARPANIPISTYLEDPGVTQAHPDTSDNKFIGYKMTYKLSGNWRLSNRLGYYDADQHVSNMYFSYFYSDTQGVNSFQYGAAGVKTFTTNLELTGKFKLGGVTNTVLIGADYLHFREFFNGVYDPSAQTIDITNPQPSYGAINLANELNPDNGFALISTQSWYGLYVQDVVSMANDRVHLLVGGRFDWAQIGSGFAIFDPAAWADANSGYENFKDHGFSPRVGLSVQVTPWASVYGNFSRALSMSNAASGTDAAGNPLPPEHAEQWEIGVKAEFFAKRLTATLAYYDIRLNDVPVAINGSPGKYYLTGQQASRGLEIDVAGRLTEGLDVIANYTHDIARVTQGYQPNPSDPQNTAELPVVGALLPATPKDIFNLWAKYSGLKSWSFAGGLSWTGQQQGDLANSFQMPSYAVVRGMISHDLRIDGKRVVLQLNFDNLLNARYFYGGTAYSNRFSLTPGAPRAVTGSIRIEF